MINKNDLFDMTFALVIIRNNIRDKSNPQILSQIIKVLETVNSTEDNQIRKAISFVDGLDREVWFFAFHNNVYVHHQMMNNADIYALLIKLLRMLICEIDKGAFDKAYDLLDCIHCLPEIVAESNFSIPKSFWKLFVEGYRNKWDKDFLRVEQKKLKNKSGIHSRKGRFS